MPTATRKFHRLRFIVQTFLSKISLSPAERLIS